MSLKKSLSLLIALSFFLEHLGLNSFEIHFNSQIPAYQHIDIDADGEYEYLNQSLGQDSVFKVKSIFLAYLKFHNYFFEVLIKKLISEFFCFNFHTIYYDNIFKPPI